ncbi:MAG: SDR family oxidoreductase, partial [Bacteroidia bacterium]|nr:SDR family oxidoreductase [Bacteroidia bacterium]
NRTADKSGYQYMSCDIGDAEQVAELFEAFEPDCIINTAAMTNVDACENDKDKAHRLNVSAVEYMIDNCKKYGAHFIHLSTDFVFDGEDGPYDEEAEPNPQSHYSKTKYEGEKLLMASGLDWCIIRTIIIYGVVDDMQRSNLVLWTKSSLEQGKDINVITDQFRAPTLSEDLAQACVSAAMKKATGVYHVAGPDIMSIIDSVKMVADFFGLDKKYIHPITTAELNQAAKRPLKTGFIIDKAKRDLDYKPHSFLEGLKFVKQQLAEKEKA